MGFVLGGCYGPTIWPPQEVPEGFEKAPSRVFISSSILARMLADLGYDPETYSYGCGHSPDGTAIRFWNKGQTEAVEVRKGQGARIITGPDAAVLDWEGNELFRFQADRHMVRFPNGKTLFAPNFMWSDSRLICYGGKYDDDQGNVKQLPLRLASIQEPQRTLATSKLDVFLEGLYVKDKTAYLIARSHAHYPNDLIVEEYAIGDSQLVLQRELTIRSPETILANWFTVNDCDPVSDSLLVSVGRQLPLGGQVYYVYNLRTERFRRIGVVWGYVAFLDREIFDGVPGGAAPRSLFGR